MKPTVENAKHMIMVYDWSIAELSDISTYGPPTKHVYYWQQYSGETREQVLRTDLERRDYWVGVLKGHNE